MRFTQTSSDANDEHHVTKCSIESHQHLQQQASDVAMAKQTIDKQLNVDKPTVS